MRQLARRLQRLEYPDAFVDLHQSFNRLVHEAALVVLGRSMHTTGPMVS
jgi:hypothetical protein